MTAATVAGQEVRLNAYTLGLERPSAIQISPFGILSVWDTDAFCSAPNVVLRRAALDGRFLAGDEPVFPCSVAGGSPSVATNSAGTFIVVAHGGMGNPDTDIAGQLFDSAGNPLGAMFMVNQDTTAFQLYPRTSALQDGSFGVVWRHDGVSSVLGRVVRADGTTPFPETRAPVDTQGSALNGRVVGLANGTVMVAWTHAYTPTNSNVRLRIFDSSFSPLSTEISVSPTISVSDIDLAAGPSGAIVTWSYPTTTLQTDIYARLLDLGGTPTTLPFVVNTHPNDRQRYPVCGMDSQGRSIVAWDSDRQDGYGYGIYAQRLDAIGVKLGPEFRVNGTTRGTFYDQYFPRLSSLPSGDFVIAWASDQDAAPAAPESAFMRRYFFPVSLLLGPGPAVGNPPRIVTSRPDGAPGPMSLLAYGAGGYGANVGAGDIDGSGLSDALTGPGPSPAYGPQVRAFRPDGTSIAKVSFYAYGTLRYGVRPAGAGIDGDPFREILTAPGAGAVFGPHVRGWNYDGVQLAPISKVSFYAYGTLQWGARVTGGEVDGDGIAELLTAPGPGPAFTPQVRGFDYDGLQLSAIAKINFNAFSTYKYGATVAAADVESDGTGGYGDGYQEIVAGTGQDPFVTAQAALFDYDASQVRYKYAVVHPPASYRYGANVAGGDIDAGDAEEVVTSTGPDPAAPARVMAWEWDPVIGTNPDGPRLQPLGPDDFVAFLGPPQLYGGAYVAVGDFE